MGLNQTGPVSGLVEFAGEWCGAKKKAVSKQVHNAEDGGRG